MTYTLFVSYARQDNVEPRTLLRKGGVSTKARTTGPVTALVAALAQSFQKRTGAPLSYFFDVKAIDEGRDWQRELGAGIRDASLLLAVVSPHWLASKHCRWEWTEYLRREHASARGDDGILQAWLASREQIAKPAKVSPVAAVLQELDRRNRSQALFPLALPWPGGVPPASAVDNLAALLVRRLIRIQLAEQAPSNVQRVAPHFVGRHVELRAIHDAICAGHGRGKSSGRTVIAAAHAPGGLGKTALARAYAHAQAAHFAAGGTWELACEGVSHLGGALTRLADDPQLQAFALRLEGEIGLSEEEKRSDDVVLDVVLTQLRGLAEANAAALNRKYGFKGAADDAADHAAKGGTSLVEPRLLLILDNVDQEVLLGAQAVQRLPQAPWLELLVTTRLDPKQAFTRDWIVAVDVTPLSEPDALALVQAHQPEGRFASDAERESALQIVRELDGYTLSVELVSAYLGVEAANGYGPTQYLERLKREGWASTDMVADEASVAQQVIHAGKRVGSVLAWSVARLSAPAATALAFASHLSPDQIPLKWLEVLTRRCHPHALEKRAGHPSPWAKVWTELNGLNLLHEARQAEQNNATLLGGSLPLMVRIHRMVAAHVSGSGRPDLGPHLDALFVDLNRQLMRQVQESGNQFPAPYSLAQQITDHLFHAVRRIPTRQMTAELGVPIDFVENCSVPGEMQLEMAKFAVGLRDKWLMETPTSVDAMLDLVDSLMRLATVYASMGHGRAYLSKKRQAYEHCKRLLSQVLITEHKSPRALLWMNRTCVELASLALRTGGDPELILALTNQAHEREVQWRSLGEKDTSEQGALLWPLYRDLKKVAQLKRQENRRRALARMQKQYWPE